MSRKKKLRPPELAQIRDALRRAGAQCKYTRDRRNKFLDLPGVRMQFSLSGKFECYWLPHMMTTHTRWDKSACASVQRTEQDQYEFYSEESDDGTNETR